MVIQFLVDIQDINLVIVQMYNNDQNDIIVMSFW